MQDAVQNDSNNDSGGGSGGNGDSGRGGYESMGDIIPSWLQASDFTLTGAVTPENIDKLNMALNYTQSNDPAGTAVLQAAWVLGARIGLNPYDHQSFGEDKAGRDEWISSEHLLLWNPNSGLQVLNSDKELIGIQSPATALVHEASHAIDPAVLSNLQDRIPQFRNLAEYLALQYEGMSAANQGEPSRSNHAGFDIRVENPTTHTGLGPSGETVWMQKKADGTIEYGPKYDFRKIEPIWFDPAQPPAPGTAPTFGSTTEVPDQGGAYHDGDDSGGGNLPDAPLPPDNSEHEPPPEHDGDGWPSENDPGAPSGGGNDGSGDTGGGNGTGDFPFDWDDGQPPEPEWDGDPTTDPSVPAVSRPRMVVGGGDAITASSSIGIDVDVDVADLPTHEVSVLQYASGPTLDFPTPLSPAKMKEFLGETWGALEIGGDTFVDAGALPAHFMRGMNPDYALGAPKGLGEVSLQVGSKSSTGGVHNIGTLTP